MPKTDNPIITNRTNLGMIDPNVQVDDAVRNRADSRALANLDAVIRSRAPLIFIETAEENKLINILSNYCDLREKKLVMWDCASGPSPLVAPQNQRTISRDHPPMVEPIDMLRFIEEDVDTATSDAEGSGGGGIYIMLDLHNWLQCSLSGAVGQMDGTERDLIRKLRSMCNVLMSDHKTIIAISRDRVLPGDLHEVVRTIQWPLPTQEEIRDEMDSLVGQLHNRIARMADNVDKTPPVYTAENLDEMARAFSGMTTERIGQIFKESTVHDYQMSASDHVSRIIIAKREIVSGSDCGLTYIDTDQLPDISEIGGLSILKDYYGRRQALFGESAREFGLPHLTGTLLIGVQGCGKSMSAKAVGKLWRLPTLRLDMGSIFTGLVGGSENRMRRAIQLMEAMAPCVVWLDEIDKSAAGTGSSDRSDAGTTSRVFSTMLTWMSDKTCPVYVVATANNPQGLPAEMIRDGRFDERFFVDLPTIPERVEIFRAHILNDDPGSLSAAKSL